MTTFEKLWPKFKRGKRYREAFVAQHAKQEIGFQIRELLKTFTLTQTELATRANLTQGVVSRAADPSYGNLTINTLVRIAAGFDVAFVGRFVPFSELPKWFDRLRTEPFTVPSFGEEDAAEEAAKQELLQRALNEPRGGNVTNIEDYFASLGGGGLRRHPRRVTQERTNGTDFNSARSGSPLHPAREIEPLSQGQRS